MNKTQTLAAGLIVLAVGLLVMPNVTAVHPFPSDPRRPDICLNESQSEPGSGEPNGSGYYSCGPAVWTDCLQGLQAPCMVCQYYRYDYGHTPSGMPNDHRTYRGCNTFP